MNRPRLLDLYCGAGGAAVGYHRAGFDIVGVDIENQKHYPYAFIRGDAVDYLRKANLRQFAVIHASPPCQAYSVTRHTHSHEHPDLLAATRDALVATGLPYVIENVVGAPMPAAVELCGAAFGLTAFDDADDAPLVLRRHRWFESQTLLMLPPCQCADYRGRGYMVGGVYGAGPQNRLKAAWRGHYAARRGGYTPSATVRARLMGIDWPMTVAELSQAIPPAYTEHIGRQLHTMLYGWEQLDLLAE